MTLQILLAVQAAFVLAEDGDTVFGLVQLIAAVLMLAGLMAVFGKAGRPPLAAIVPVLAEIVLLRIVVLPRWWLLLLLLPLAELITIVTTETSLPFPIGFVAWVAQLVVLVLLCGRFGKGTGFYLGMVFLAPLFLPILGLGPAKYTPPFRSRRQSGRGKR